MATYLNVTFNHFAALQKWITETGGAATLDMNDFTVEVKHRGRYYRMYPMFQAHVDGSLVHLPTLTPQVKGFGGWRPYQTLTHPHSSDKQLFKQFLAEAGLRTPQAWGAVAGPPQKDYVLKARQGSFGRGLFGPYRAGVQPTAGAQQGEDGTMFAEQFVSGQMLKVWYWGARPFFAHMQSYPVIVGDGQSSAEALVRQKAAASAGWDARAQLPVAVDCLAYQGVAWSEVVGAGREHWIDYRYGQQYPTTSGATAATDNQLESLRELSGSQLGEMGSALARLLQKTIPVPVVITVDGILDHSGAIWWLEMNTNSLLPPEGYAAMFADLFG